MAYICKNTEKRETIKACIARFCAEKGRMPTMRDIAARTGISRAMVQRYMAAMQEAGELSYAGRATATAPCPPDAVSVPFYGCLPTPETEPLSTFLWPRGFVGEGDLCLFEMDDDAMTGAGIAPHALLLMRRGDAFADGDLVLVETDEETILLRKVYRRAGGLLLRAANPRYGDSMVHGGRVLGIVIKTVQDTGSGKTVASEETTPASLQVFLL